MCLWQIWKIKDSSRQFPSFHVFQVTWKHIWNVFWNQLVVISSELLPRSCACISVWRDVQRGGPEVGAGTATSHPRHLSIKYPRLSNGSIRRGTSLAGADDSRWHDSRGLCANYANNERWQRAARPLSADPRSTSTPPPRQPSSLTSYFWGWSLNAFIAAFMMGHLGSIIVPVQCRSSLSAVKSPRLV